MHYPSLPHCVQPQPEKPKDGKKDESAASKSGDKAEGVEEQVTRSCVFYLGMCVGRLCASCAVALRIRRNVSHPLLIPLFVCMHVGEAYFT